MLICFHVEVLLITGLMLNFPHSIKLIYMKLLLLELHATAARNVGFRKSVFATLITGQLNLLRPFFMVVLQMWLGLIILSPIATAFFECNLTFQKCFAVIGQDVIQPRHQKKWVFSSIPQFLLIFIVFQVNLSDIVI